MLLPSKLKGPEERRLLRNGNKDKDKRMSENRCWPSKNWWRSF